MHFLLQHIIHENLVGIYYNLICTVCDLKKSLVTHVGTIHEQLT